MAENRVVDVFTILPILQGLEDELGELYLWFSDLFEANPAASVAFARLSRDERNHSSMVAYLRRLVRQSSSRFAAVMTDAGRVEDALRQVRACRQLPTPPHLEDAVRLAVALEMAAAEAHLPRTVGAEDEELRRLLEGLGAGDREHLERLRALAADLGIPA